MGCNRYLGAELVLEKRGGMRIKKMAAWALGLLCVGAHAERLDVSALLTMPTGDFGSSNDGLAQPGIGLGGGYWRDYDSTMSYGVEGFFLFNPFDTETAEREFEQIASSASVSGAHYINVPLLGALSVKLPLQNGRILNVFAGAGMDFLFMTDFEAAVDGEEILITFSADPAMAYSFGGLLEGRRYYLGFRYMHLGKHDLIVKGTFDGETSNSRAEQEVSLMAFSAGWKF
jgi:hypothetical protein